MRQGRGHQVKKALLSRRESEEKTSGERGELGGVSLAYIGIKTIVFEPGLLCNTM